MQKFAILILLSIFTLPVLATDVPAKQVSVDTNGFTVMMNLSSNLQGMLRYIDSHFAVPTNYAPRYTTNAYASTYTPRWIGDVLIVTNENNSITPRQIWVSQDTGTSSWFYASPPAVYTNSTCTGNVPAYVGQLMVQAKHGSTPTNILRIAAGPTATNWIIVFRGTP